MDLMRRQMLGQFTKDEPRLLPRESEEAQSEVAAQGVEGYQRFETRDERRDLLVDGVRIRQIVRDSLKEKDGV